MGIEITGDKFNMDLKSLIEKHLQIKTGAHIFTKIEVVAKPGITYIYFDSNIDGGATK